MKPKFAYDVGAALTDRRPSFLSHRTTGLPETLAEAHLTILFSKRYAHQFQHGHDDQGDPVPLPIVTWQVFNSFWPRIGSSEVISQVFAPPAQFQESNTPRFRLLRFPDQSIIFLESTSSGYAVFPVALFSEPDEQPQDDEIYADLKIYAQAMRKMPPAQMNLTYYTDLAASSHCVVPHWLHLNSRGDQALGTLFAFKNLAEYFAVRLGKISPGYSASFSTTGRPIQRDGTTADAKVSIELHAPYPHPSTKELEEEFTALINHPAYAEEHYSLAMHSDHVIFSGSVSPEKLFSATIEIPAESQSAHDIIEATRRAQPWLNPS